jgi:hypothetical protein
MHHHRHSDTARSPATSVFVQQAQAQAQAQAHALGSRPSTALPGYRHAPPGPSPSPRRADAYAGPASVPSPLGFPPPLYSEDRGGPRPWFPAPVRQPYTTDPAPHPDADRYTHHPQQRLTASNHHPPPPLQWVRHPSAGAASSPSWAAAAGPGRQQQAP